MNHLLPLRQTRKALRMSQKSMADYLAVSRSAITMAELGKRRLPDLAVLRLAALQAQTSKSPDHHPEIIRSIVTGNEKVAKHVEAGWEFKLKEAEYRKSKAILKLQQMEKEYEGLKQLCNGLKILLEQTPTDMPAHTLIKLKYQYVRAGGQLEDCNEAQQKATACRIQLLTSEIETMQRVIAQEAESRANIIQHNDLQTQAI